MTEISSTATQSKTFGKAASTANSDEKKKSTGSDFETFLKMLTTQMQNQDPLNPMDSTEFASQLATFSSVEQQTKTNQLLEGMGAQFGVLGMSQLASWVGHEARTTAMVWNDSQPKDLTFTPDQKADRVMLVVKDKTGATVSRQDLPLGSKTLNWRWESMKGGVLPAGMYSFGIENYKDSKLVSSGEVESYATILEARSGPQGASLILRGGVEVDATKISALRKSPS